MFNYREEKKRFDKKWEILEREYEAAGMSQEGILEMKEFDLEAFRRARNEANHRANMILDSGEQLEGNTDQVLYTNGHYITFESNLFEGPYEWIHDLEDTSLLKGIKELSVEDLELLVLLAIEGYSQAEIARKKGCSRNSISKKIKKIKSFF